MRRTGKSLVSKLAREWALNAGRTVIVCTPESTTLQRKKKHLTLIEMLPNKETKTWIIRDEVDL